MSGADFGVYVHVPFCTSRCDYCAFAVWTDRRHLADRYVRACVEELRRARDESMALAGSLYLGGGTPSLLRPDQVALIVEAAGPARGAEVTMECNPEDASRAALEAWRSAGVTRLSLGVQSTDPAVLGSLGRRFGPAPSPGVLLGWAWDAGFESVSVDLIFGAAAETDASWARTIEEVIGAPQPPAHVSTYALTVEPGTPLASDHRRHPDDDVQARRYGMADKALGGSGYAWYEVSSWAKPGHRCRHNQLYWAQGDYRGVGCSAHSHRGGTRWWNVRTPERYVGLVEAGRPAVAAEEILDAEQREFEALALALRTDRGVPSEALAVEPELEGLVSRTADRAVLTVRGRLLANELSSRLLLARERPGQGRVLDGKRYPAPHVRAGSGRARGPHGADSQPVQTPGLHLSLR